MKRFDCEAVGPLLLPWQEGALPFWDGWHIRQHVRHCPACARELAAHAHLTQTLRGITPFGREKEPVGSFVPRGANRFEWAAALVVFCLLSVGLPFFVRQHSKPRSIAVTVPQPRQSTMAQATTQMIRTAIPDDRPMVPTIVPTKTPVKEAGIAVIKRYRNRRYAQATYYRRHHRRSPAGKTRLAAVSVRPRIAVPVEQIMIVAVKPASVIRPIDNSENTGEESLYIEAHPVPTDTSRTIMR